MAGRFSLSTGMPMRPSWTSILGDKLPASRGKRSMPLTSRRLACAIGSNPSGLRIGTAGV